MKDMVGIYGSVYESHIEVPLKISVLKRYSYLYIIRNACEIVKGVLHKISENEIM